MTNIGSYGEVTEYIHINYKEPYCISKNTIRRVNGDIEIEDGKKV